MKKSLLFGFASVVLLLSTSSVNAQTYPQPNTFSFQANDFNLSGISSGSFFNDPVYFSPGLKYLTKSLIYSTSLWFGGKDSQGQIHGAFQTYGQNGYDIFGGPAADIYDENSVFNIWNTQFYITKAEVENHIANWESPGYNVPFNINQWPTRGSSALGESEFLAPFEDLNGNQLYEPQLGEYPRFPGDYCILSIYNDNRPHEESYCQVVKAEVLQYLYWFDAENYPTLKNVIFSKHHLRNRSTIFYSDFKTGLFVDGDLGNFSDDYLGSDPSLNLCYYYNGDEEDEGPLGFGSASPALGIVQLHGEFSGVIGDIFSVPQSQSQYTCTQYYQALSRIWIDGNPLTSGGTGYQSGEPTNFIYNDREDWTELSAGIAPGDRRALICSDIDLFGPNEVICLDYAFVFHLDSLKNSNAVDVLKSQVAEVRNNSIVQSLTSNCDLSLSVRELPDSKGIVKVFPNPSNAMVQFNTEKNTIISIYDVQGRLINRFNCDGNCSWNSNETSPGVLIIVAESKDGIRSTQRLVKY
jgi:hypothetical protein